MAEAHFHALRVADIRREAEDAVSVAFDVPQALADKFRFIPGQYVTLRRDIDGEDVRRAYSICSTPAENELRIAAKRMIHGKMSNLINDILKPGDAVDVLEPAGRFSMPDDAPATAHFVGIAGGSGITPFHSIIRSALADRRECRFTLIYGNRSRRSIIFRDSLDQLIEQYPGRFTLHYVLSDEPGDSELLSGLLDEAKCSALIDAYIDPLDVTCFFVCGPTPMVKAARAALIGHEVPPAKMRFELFGTPGRPQAAP